MTETVRSRVLDARVAQMLDHFTQYVGSAPDTSPAVLCGIAHMQTSEGVWYPVGGTGAVPCALTRLATELGVEIRTGTGVRRILQTSTGSVRGVETEGGTVPLDGARLQFRRRPDASRAAGSQGSKVLREPAPVRTGLFGGRALPWARSTLRPAPAPQFRLFRKPGGGVRRHLPARRACSRSNLLRLCPSADRAGVAPAGGDSLYVLVHTPYLRPHHDWNSLFPAYRKTILDKLMRRPG